MSRAVVLVVALKYVVMRADNHGEGGTMALIWLALPAAGGLRTVLLTIGLGGASLFVAECQMNIRPNCKTSAPPTMRGFGIPPVTTAK